MKTLAFVLSAALAATAGLAAQAQDLDGVYAGGGLAWSGADVGSDLTLVGYAMPDPHGFNGFAVVGYNKSFGALVLGVEGDLSFGAVDTNEPCSNPAWTCGSTIRQSATLRARAGTVVAGNFLFASLGYSAAKVELETVSSLGTVYPDSHTLFGWTVGLGAERTLQDGWTLRGEVLYTDYNGTDFVTDVPYPEMGASVTTVRLGVTRRF